MNVVSVIYWTAEKTLGDCVAIMPGMTNLPSAQAFSFVDFADLTEAQLIGWINQHTDAVSLEQYEQELTKWLQAQKAKRIVFPVLPWMQKPQELDVLEQK
jgi:hypothetical protein